MYKLSVPIAPDTLTEESLPLYKELLTQCGVQRVFLCCLGEIYRKDSMIYTDAPRLRKLLSFFRELGMEVGLWVNTFGHGHLLAHQKPNEVGDYERMECVTGKTLPVAYCALDPRFVKDYTDGMRQLASLGPDLIMLDDDMRYSRPALQLACFCPRHLKWFYELVGEEVPRDQIEEKIFTGGPNKYRNAFLSMMGQTLLDFSKALRAAVDDVDSSIRLGPSVTTGVWDFSGTDVLELAKTLAGNTAPFARISGAPYHNNDIIPIIQASRQQCAWGKDSGVELFCEGDTYPRPRCNVPSRPLELFDLAMLADGTSHGMLQYIFDYTHNLRYETGYARRLLRNMPLRRQVADMFAGKTAAGVEVFDVMHKLRNWVLPDTMDRDTVKWYHGMPSKGVSADFLARSCIPTAFAPCGYPVMLFGENARYISVDALKNGAILDLAAAQILQSRGIDTGLLQAEAAAFLGEEFPAMGETVLNIGKLGMARIRCRENAQVETRFIPDGTPASYRYENADGQRFFVLSLTAHTPKTGGAFTGNFLRNWCRRKQLVDIVPWLCGKPLPAYLDNAPCTCLLASKDEKAMAVAVLNLYQDEIIEPVIQLDRAYEHAQFAGCTGRLEGDRVYLSDIAPYGFCAFTVD